LNSLATNWASEYGRQNPSVNLSIMNIPGDQAVGSEGIYLLSDDYAGLPGNGATWKICLGHEAIVPVFNIMNPMFSDISGQGISIDAFARLYSGSGKITWGDLINGGQNKAVTLYIRL
jgi:hypothetical protein